MDPVPHDDLSAAQLAELTGVPAGTLRVWETRYGFPEPRRDQGGRKRYARADVARVASVLAQRRRGISMAVAIQRVKADPTRRVPSLFAALRNSRPDLQVRVLHKPALTALSRAIEDEFSSRAPGGALFGSFQFEPHYRASERRWRALSRAADVSIVLADFPRTRLVVGGPSEVAMGSQHPMDREWSVVVNSSIVTACLAGCEVQESASVPDAERRFETVWSFDPAVVFDATRAFSQIVEGLAPDVAAQIPADLTEAPAASSAELRTGSDLGMRAISYLAAEMTRGSKR